MGSLTEDNVHALIAGVYDAALGRLDWTEWLNQFSATAGYAKMTLIGFDRASAKSLGVINGNYDPAYIESYFSHYGDINPWAMPMAHLKAGSWAAAECMVPLQEVENSEFYAGWVRPQEDIVGGCALSVFNDENRSLLMTSNFRRKDIEHVAPRVQVLYQTLIPHLQRGAALMWQLAGKHTESVSMAASLLDCPAFLVDGTMRPVFINEMADALLRSAMLLRSGGGRIAFRSPALHDKITAQVQALTTARFGDGTVEGLTAEDHNGQTHMVRIVPVPANPDTPLQNLLAPKLALIMLRPQRRHLTPAETMALRYGLTAAERAILQHLLSGQDLRRIADLRKASLHTLRSQIKSIMSKCGVSRQAELVALALRHSSGE
ncbi:MAG: helix-turn-helix transcriptional regulator [Hyphomicrobiales bacterium]